MPAGGRRSAWWILGAALLLGAVLMHFFVPGRDALPLGQADRLQDLRRRGAFAEARALLEDLDSRWAGSSETRRMVVAAQREALEATAGAADTRGAAARDEARELSWAEHVARLQRETESGASRADREAARIVLARLKEIRDEATRIVAAAPDPLAERFRALEEAMRRPQPVPPPVTADEPSTVDPARGRSNAEVQAVLTDTDALLAQERYAAALELLRQALPRLSAADAAPLHRRLAEVRAATQQAIETLIARAEAERIAGRLDAAVALLEVRAPDFPASGDLARVAHALGAYKRELAASLRMAALVPEAARPPAPAPEARASETPRAAVLDAALEAKARSARDRLLKAVRGNDPAAREQALEGLLALGTDAVDSVVPALDRECDVLLGRLEKHPFRRTVERLAVRRKELDRLREHARTLIYDEVKYFYPFRPPAVDGARAAEYWPVQQEVDARVARLRAVWEGDKAKATIPSELHREALRVQWLCDLMATFRRPRADVDERIGWVTAMPRDGVLTLQNFCISASELESQRLYRRIELWNQRLLPLLSREEQRQLEVTNAYRRMFGHRPLALNRKLLQAARGHSKEMATLGFFDHFSPTPGRRTPFERMRLEGYLNGVSENIAMVDGPDVAHLAWLHSSGHHRNLLSPSHTEFGVGNQGRLWTQNFGTGREYAGDPEFPAEK